MSHHWREKEAMSIQRLMTGRANLFLQQSEEIIQLQRNVSSLAKKNHEPMRQVHDLVSRLQQYPPPRRPDETRPIQEAESKYGFSSSSSETEDNKSDYSTDSHQTVYPEETLTLVIPLTPELTPIPHEKEQPPLLDLPKPEIKLSPAVPIFPRANIFQPDHSPLEDKPAHSSPVAKAKMLQILRQRHPRVLEMQEKVKEWNRTSDEVYTL
jgi:hypothetical protein